MIYKLIEAFSAAVVLIPIFLVLHRTLIHDPRKSLLYGLFALYLAAVYNLVGLPTVQFLTFEVTLNLIPFAGMMDDLKNSLLNILLFVPLGIFLPLLWKKYRRTGTLLSFGFGMTVVIECLQLLTYRATDINDIITNLLGTWLGFFVFRLTERFLLSGTKPSRKTSSLWLIILIVMAVMFFVQPIIASFIYRIT